MKRENRELYQEPNVHLSQTIDNMITWFDKLHMDNFRITKIISTLKELSLSVTEQLESTSEPIFSRNTTRLIMTIIKTPNQNWCSNEDFIELQSLAFKCLYLISDCEEELNHIAENYDMIPTIRDMLISWFLADVSEDPIKLDYSIVNEFCRIDRPSQAVLNLGHLLCQFLHFVKDPANSVELIDVEGKTWQDVCMVVKRNISNSLFEFKERIKSLVKNKLPEQASQLLKWLKKAQYLMKQELRPSRRLT